MSADFEVEMVLVGEVLLRTRNLPLVIEFLTTATAILARSSALEGRSSFYSITSRSHSMRAHTILDFRLRRETFGERERRVARASNDFRF